MAAVRRSTVDASVTGGSGQEKAPRGAGQLMMNKALTTASGPLRQALEPAPAFGVVKVEGDGWRWLGWRPHQRDHQHSQQVPVLQLYNLSTRATAMHSF
jgi:hypothetical protein